MNDFLIHQQALPATTSGTASARTRGNRHSKDGFQTMHGWRLKFDKFYLSDVSLNSRLKGCRSLSEYS